MSTAFAITVAAILAGALVGFLARSGPWLGALRTFALVGVVTVVLVQLLPEAVTSLGIWALLAFALALVAPALIARAFRRVSPNATITAAGICVEVGFLGFVGHQIAEGLALGTYTGPAHAGHEHGSLVWAIAAHTVPLTAVLIAAARDNRGERSAWMRTAVLVGSTGLGFAVADVVGGATTEGIHAWGAAIIAGLLTHVLLHEEGPHRRDSIAVRTVDVLAALAGAALPIWATVVSEGHVVEAAAQSAHVHVREAFADALIELSLETAPMLLLGLALGALLQLWGARIPARWLNRGSAPRQALRGMLVGAPLPLCACGVLPLAESLRKRGAGPALVIAFLIATPELGPEALTLTVRFFGWPFALARLGAALLLAYTAGLVFARLLGRGDADARGTIEVGGDDARPALVRLFGYFDELLLHVAPWTFVGLVAAAFIEVALPAGAMASLSDSGLDIFVIALVAVPTYVCAASATPLAAVLLAKGISPGAVLVGLLLGPATNIATIALLRRSYGARVVGIGVAAILAISFAMGFALNAIDLPITAPPPLTDAHEHGIATYVATALLGGALVVQLWRTGVAPWFSVLDAGEHDHPHDHGRHHGHDHGRHHGHDHAHEHDH